MTHFELNIQLYLLFFSYRWKKQFQVFAAGKYVRPRAVFLHNFTMTVSVTIGLKVRCAVRRVTG
jgi:hypothetical protein